MLELLDAFHRALRYAHIGLGGIGLALFWIPIFAPKGGKWHVRCGKAFVWCAYVVGGTGLVSSIWALADLESFVMEPQSSWDPARHPIVAAQVRFLFALLAFLSLAIIAGARFGVRVMRTRRDHAALATRELIGLEFASGLAAGALAIYGAYNVYLGVSNQHPLGKSAIGMYSILIGVGAFGVVSVRGDLKYILHPRPTPMSWWYKHMENMIGVGIGFHTAFLVFGARRLIGGSLHGAWNLVPWILPTVIGGVATAKWVKYYKHKFGELPAGDTPTPPGMHSVVS